MLTKITDKHFHLQRITNNLMIVYLGSGRLNGRREAKPEVCLASEPQFP